MIAKAIGGVLRWIVRRVGSRNLLLLILLLAAVSSLAAGIAGRVRSVDVWLLLTVGVLGVLTGWGLAAVSLPDGIGGLLASLLGFGVVFLRVGRLGGKLVTLLRASSDLMREIQRWPLGGGASSWRMVVQATSDLGGDVGTLIARVYRWGAALVMGEPAFDPVAVAFVWSLAAWAVSVWMAWVVSRRGRPLRAVAPAGVLLMATLYQVWGEHVSLLILLGTTLLLMAMMAYDRRMSRWVATGVDFPELRLETASVVVFLSVALVTVAGMAPSLSVRAIVEFVQDLGGGRSEEVEAVAESLGMEQQAATIFDEMDLGGLPRSHLLGAGPELSERVVMVISTGELPPGPSETPGEGPPRYYWRSHSLDRYAGTGWYPGETTLVAYQAV